MDFQTGPHSGANLSICSTLDIVTLAGSSSETSNLIPAGAVVLAVSARGSGVESGGAPVAWNLGDNTDPDRYGAGISSEGSVEARDYTAEPAGVWSPAAREALITSAGGLFSGGQVQVVAHYILARAPQ